MAIATEAAISPIAHPWQTESVDPADAAAEKKQFQSGAGAFEGIQLVVVVFVVDHGDAAEQTEKYGDWKHGPVKAKNSGDLGGGVVVANLCGAASGALQVKWGVGLIKDPAMARQRINPNAKPPHDDSWIECHATTAQFGEPQVAFPERYSRMFAWWGSAQQPSSPECVGPNQR